MGTFMARPSPQHRLSPVFVRTFTTPSVYVDGGGLRLRIMPNGSRTWIRRITVRGVRDEVSEAALAHTDQNQVRAAYRRTTFLEERRDAGVGGFYRPKSFSTCPNRSGTAQERVGWPPSSG
jgi:hypothetical protein